MLVGIVFDKSVSRWFFFRKLHSFTHSGVHCVFIGISNFFFSSNLCFQISYPLWKTPTKFQSNNKCSQKTCYKNVSNSASQFWWQIVCILGCYFFLFTVLILLVFLFVWTMSAVCNDAAPLTESFSDVYHGVSIEWKETKK